MRTALVLIISTAITYCIFLLMSQLIQSNTQSPTLIKPVETIEFTIIKSEPIATQPLTKTQVSNSTPEPAAPLITAAKLVNINANPVSLNSLATNLSPTLLPSFANMPAPEIKQTSQPQNSMAELSLSRQAVVLLKVEPRYPQRALQRQIEGFVTVEFIIDAQGRAQQVEIITAQPQKIFNRNVIRAVKKSKYQPELDNGQVTNKKVRQTFNFNYDND